MRRLQFLLLAIALTGCLPTGSAKVVVRSPDFPLEHVVLSRQAIEAGHKFLLLDDQPGELVWVTDVDLKVRNENKEEIKADKAEFSSLDFRWPQWHNEKFTTGQSSRLFGFGRGAQSFSLPPGFGIPMQSNEPLWLSARMSNPPPFKEKLNLHQELTVGFTRERGLEKEIKPLLIRTAEIYVDGKYDWPVEPGKRIIINRLDFHKREGRPILIHALTAWTRHPGARLQLREVGSLGSLISLDPGSVEGKPALESFSDPKGVRLDPSRDYELVVTYENSTKLPIVGCCYMTFYIDDTHFKKPPR